MNTLVLDVLARKFKLLGTGSALGGSDNRGMQNPFASIVQASKSQAT